MSVWTGWQADLLNAAGFPNSAANRTFLSAWHQHATSNCTRNPVDISKQTGSWTACKHLDAGRTANNYGNQKSAEDAFKGQVFGSEYLSLNEGFFNSSLDASDADPGVIAEIRVWGSAAFADFLQKQAAGAGGGGAGVNAPGIHKGWSELRKSISPGLTGAVREASKMSTASLRSLSRARKVRL